MKHLQHAEVASWMVPWPSELRGTCFFSSVPHFDDVSSTLGLCGPLISETVLCSLAGSQGDFLLIGEHALNPNCTPYSSVGYLLDQKMYGDTCKHSSVQLMCAPSLPLYALGSAVMSCTMWSTNYNSSYFKYFRDIKLKKNTSRLLAGNDCTTTLLWKLPVLNLKREHMQKYHGPALHCVLNS